MSCHRTKILKKATEGSVSLTLSFRVHSVTAGKPWRQGLETAGHMSFVVSKQGVVNTCENSLASFHSGWDPSAWNGAGYMEVVSSHHN